MFSEYKINVLSNWHTKLNKNKNIQKNENRERGVREKKIVIKTKKERKSSGSRVR